MLFVKISKLLFAIIAVSILVLSLIPDTPSGFGRLSDKANHIIAYGVLACLFIFAFSAKNIHWGFLLIISIGACTLYGGLIEILQQFTHRSPELLDFTADFLGSVAGTLAATGFVFLKKKLHS